MRISLCGAFNRYFIVLFFLAYGSTYQMRLKIFADARYNSVKFFLLAPRCNNYDNYVFLYFA